MENIQKILKERGEIMLTIFKWVLLILLSVAGMVLATDPNYQTTGFILAFGCFLLFALDVARNFIN